MHPTDPIHYPSITPPVRQLRADREWTTIHGKPTLIAHSLSGMDGVYVQCRLPNGEDVFISPKEIFALFTKELAADIKVKGGS